SPKRPLVSRGSLAPTSALLRVVRPSRSERPFWPRRPCAIRWRIGATSPVRRGRAPGLRVVPSFSRPPHSPSGTLLDSTDPLRLLTPLPHTPRVSFPCVVTGVPRRPTQGPPVPV